MTRAFVLAFVLLATAASAPAQNADATGSPNFQFPLVKGHGGIVVAVPDAAQQPKKNSKVLLDIVSDEMSGSAIKGFAMDEVAEPVTTAASAATVNINKQWEGYASILFH